MQDCELKISFYGFSLLFAKFTSLGDRKEHLEAQFNSFYEHLRICLLESLKYCQLYDF